MACRMSKTVFEVLFQHGGWFVNSGVNVKMLTRVLFGQFNFKRFRNQKQASCELCPGVERGVCIMAENPSKGWQELSSLLSRRTIKWFECWNNSALVRMLWNLSLQDVFWWVSHALAWFSGIALHRIYLLLRLFASGYSFEWNLSAIRRKTRNVV